MPQNIFNICYSLRCCHGWVAKVDETMDSYSRDPRFESPILVWHTWGDVMTEWMRPQTLIREIHGSNPNVGMTYLRSCHSWVDETMDSYSRDPRFESHDMTYLWSCPCIIEWRRLRTREVLCSNLLMAAVVPLGKALYPHCLVPRIGLKAVGPLVAKLQVTCLCSCQVK